MIIVSPNSYLGKKQGSVDYVNLPEPITTKVSSLPAPIAASIRAANKNQTEITLPTGIFTFSQFQQGNNEFVKDVLEFVGVGSPMVSSLIMDASNYKDIASGKATASLSILLNKDNLINKTVELTQILKSVAAPPFPC
jgi:hypothetical protein